MTGSRILALAVFVLGAGTFLALMLLRSCAPTDPVRTERDQNRREYEAAVGAQQQRYESVPRFMRLGFGPGDPPSVREMREAYSDQLLANMEGPPGVATGPALRESLAQTIAEYVATLCLADAESYIDLIARRGYIPLDANSPGWANAETAIDFFLGPEADADRSDPIGALRTIVGPTLFADGRVFVDAGAGPDGSQVRLLTVDRAAQSEWSGGFSVAEGSGESPDHLEYWIAKGLAGSVIAQPPVSLSDLIGRDGGALVAQAGVVLFREDAAPCAWWSTWQWDEERASWFYSSGGLSAAGMAFYH